MVILRKKKRHSEHLDRFCLIFHPNSELFDTFLKIVWIVRYDMCWYINFCNRMLFFSINSRDFRKNATKNECLNQFSDESNKVGLKKAIG